MSKIKVMIVDDHALVREGIAAFLKMSSDIETVGEAADGLEAIEGVKKFNPDVILMDIAMPKLGGLEAITEIKKINPTAKILVLTQYDDKEYVKRFLKAGAAGYLLKKAVGMDLINAIKSIARGEAYLHPSIAASIIEEYCGERKVESEDPYDTLTDREKQVLKLIAEGYTSKEIADILGISVKTATAHQTHLSEKLDIHTRAGLIKFAIAKGLIKL